MQLVSLLFIMIFLIVVALPLCCGGWLWFKYDRHVSRLRDEVLDIPAKINENNRGRGLTIQSQEMQINAAKRPIEIELRKLESARQLFLDRAHIVLLFKLK